LSKNVDHLINKGRNI